MEYKYCPTCKTQFIMYGFTAVRCQGCGAMLVDGQLKRPDNVRRFIDYSHKPNASIKNDDTQQLVQGSFLS